VIVKDVAETPEDVKIHVTEATDAPLADHYSYFDEFPRVICWSSAAFALILALFILFEWLLQ
jgi:hypothetical protein